MGGRSALVGALLLAACGPATAEPVTLTYTAVYDEEAVVDAPPDGDSLGDEQSLSGTLYEEGGVRAGEFAVVCTWVGVTTGAVREHCSSWMETDEGLLTSAGPSSDDATELSWAVTGGTGRFSRANGEVRIVVTPDGLDVTIELLDVP